MTAHTSKDLKRGLRTSPRRKPKEKRDTTHSQKTVVRQVRKSKRSEYGR